MSGYGRVIRVILFLTLALGSTGATSSTSGTTGLGAQTSNGWTVVSELGAASSSGLSPLSDARAVEVVDALATTAIAGEALDHRWVVAKDGVTGLAELYASSQTAGRMVISAMTQDGDSEIERLVAEFDIRGGVMDVTIVTDDGQLLDQQSATLSTNCESDNSSCVAAAAAGAVTVACAAGFALAPLTFGLTAVIGAAACTVAGAAGIASGLACSAEPEPCPTPQMRLTCDTDSCTAVVSYVLALRRDYHELVFEWESTPAPGYPNNNADVVLRQINSGIAQTVSIFGVGTGYRYRVSDFIWHSDIRCDAAMKVTVTSSQTGPNIKTVGKSVPSNPDNAYCSDYGMYGEIT